MHEQEDARCRAGYGRGGIGNDAAAPAGRGLVDILVGFRDNIIQRSLRRNQRNAGGQGQFQLAAQMIPEGLALQRAHDFLDGFRAA